MSDHEAAPDFPEHKPGLPQYPSDLWAVSEADLSRFGLSRVQGGDEHGMIQDRYGRKVCAYTGRSHWVFLLWVKRKVGGGWSRDWVDQKAAQGIVPKRNQIMRLLGQVAGELALKKLKEKAGE